MSNRERSEMQTTRLQTLKITHGPGGRRLRKPVVLKVPRAENPRTERLYRYIIDAFTCRKPALVEFTLQNESCMKLATHLLRHNSGSEGSLYQYIYGVHRFTRWMNRSPDELIAECKTPQGLTDIGSLERHANVLDNFVGDLQAEGLAPATISSLVKGVKAL